MSPDRVERVLDYYQRNRRGAGTTHAIDLASGIKRLPEKDSRMGKHPGDGANDHLSQATIRDVSESGCK